VPKTSVNGKVLKALKIGLNQTFFSTSTRSKIKNPKGKSTLSFGTPKTSPKIDLLSYKTLIKKL
jgi:hypothetical protein